MKTLSISRKTPSVRSSLWISGAIFALVLPLAACSSAQTAPTVSTGANCASLTDGGQVLSDFYKPGAVYDAKPVQERVFRARAIQPVETMGASLYVKATPEMNAPYLRRVLSCHAASSSSAHVNDPLHPSSGPIAALEVGESRYGFKVDIRARDSKGGEEIWKRAESLSRQNGSVQAEQVGGLDNPSTTF